MAGHEHVQHYAQPSRVCDFRDLGRIGKLSEICKWWLKSLALAFLQRHADQPVLISYGSDCTPLVTRHRYARSWGHLAVSRSGKSGGEWLVQRCFMLSGNNERHVLFCEPRLLVDKTAWSHFSAFRELLPLGRECGHSGLLVSHHIYDRAVFSAMTRHHRELHMARKVHEEAILHEGAARWRWLLSWFTSAGCVNHDAHNSLKWGALAFYSEKATPRNMFICIESLRQSFDELVIHAPGWIARSLRYENSPSPDGLRRLWTLCDLSSEWVDQLVELELRFEDGVLKVHTRWQDDLELPDMLMTVLLYIWRWRRFSDSRWVTLGASCRCLLASLCCGLQDFVNEILRQPGAHTYYLKGFHFLDREALALTALIACSSFVADAVLSALLVDDRVPIMFDELQQEMASEVDYVEQMDEPVIGFIAKTCGMNAKLLRDQTNSSALIQAGFFSQRIRAATKPPWCILRKPPAEALAELAAAPRPPEETLGKIWDLLALGYSRPLLEKGLRLLGMASWSSTPVEQAHVAASGLMRKHSDYGQQTLAARSMLVSMAPLFKPSESDLKFRRLQLRLASLEKRRPECISGRQVFLQDLNSKAAEMRTQGRPLAADMHTKLMHRHGGMWKESSAGVRAAYEAKAELTRDQVREELVHKKQVLLAEMQIMRARCCTEDRDGEPLRVSSCRFSELRIAEFNGLYESPEWSAKRVAELQAAALEPLGPPPLAVQEILEGMEIYHDDPRPAMAPWVALLCHQVVLPELSVAIRCAGCSSVLSLHLCHAESISGLLFACAAHGARAGLHAPSHLGRDGNIGLAAWLPVHWP